MCSSIFRWRTNAVCSKSVEVDCVVDVSSRNLLVDLTALRRTSTNWQITDPLTASTFQLNICQNLLPNQVGVISGLMVQVVYDVIVIKCCLLSWNMPGHDCNSPLDFFLFFFPRLAAQQTQLCVRLMPQGSPSPLVACPPPNTILSPTSYVPIKPLLIANDLI
jgi:hypothetical protein